ncbi:MAG: hypothetical protein ACRDOO_18795 [Actinomadura sp.]
MRNRVEKIALALMAALGIVVSLADLVGWLDVLAPGGALPKVTLLILSTVSLFLLLEVDRLKMIDNIHAQLSKLDIDASARELKSKHYAGVLQVHKEFPEKAFAGYLDSASRGVMILQTWIPNLHKFEEELVRAIVDRQVQVRILLLHPSSGVAQLREEALRAVRDPALEFDVKTSVKRCLSILESIFRSVGADQKERLEVRVYNALPSIAVYKVDERYLISSFLHGQLAIDSTQIEVEGPGTAMGQQIQRELDTLWEIGHSVEFPDWRTSVDTISL